MARDPSFAPAAGDLVTPRIAPLEVAAAATAGQGVALGANGILPPSSLAPTPVDAYVLTWDAATLQQKWAAVTIPTVGYGTSLPGSPANTDEYILVDSVTLPTYQWRFRYNSGSSNTDKWEAIGPLPVMSSNRGATVTNAAYADLSALATVTVPRAGVYEVVYGGFSFINSGATAHLSLKKGSAATADADSINGQAAVNSLSGTLTSVVTGLAASDVLKLQGKITAGTLTLSNQFISVTPVRVS